MVNENNTLFCTNNLQFLFILFFIITTSCGSEKKSERPSPPASDSVEVEGANMKIEYSSPGVKERKIWDGLVPYFKIWRTGANEATVFTTSKDLIIKGDTLQAGKYAIFTIPTEEKWTLIFNKEWDQWGAYNYDSSRDAIRIEIAPQMVPEHQERLQFYFKGSTLHFHWEYVTFSVEFEII